MNTAQNFGRFSITILILNIISLNSRIPYFTMPFICLSTANLGALILAYGATKLGIK
jgi:hypothetical protein